MKGNVTLEKYYGEGTQVREIEVSYLIVDAMFPYNIILGHPTITVLGEILHTLYLVLKYLLLDGESGQLEETIWALKSLP